MSTITLTESEKSAVFIAIVEENKRMNAEIDELNRKIENERCRFETAMKYIRDRDTLIYRRQFLFSVVDKFKNTD